jgi:hypothetical protein
MRRDERSEQFIYRIVMEHIAARAMPSTFFIASVPDILSIKDGRLFMLELMAPDGRLSDAQHLMIAELHALGAAVAVVDSVNAALNRLEGWGILRGCRH